MYDAARQNISASNVKYAVSFYGKKYTFGKIFRLIDVLAENLKEKYGDMVVGSSFPTTITAGFHCHCQIIGTAECRYK